MEASITASHAYSHHIYRISELVSMITGSIKLIDMATLVLIRLLQDQGHRSHTIYQCSLSRVKLII